MKETINNQTKLGMEKHHQQKIKNHHHKIKPNDKKKEKKKVLNIQMIKICNVLKIH